MAESTPVGDELDGGTYPLTDAGQRLEWADGDGESFDALSKWFNETRAYALLVQREGNRWEARWHSFIEPEVEAEKLTELARLLGSFLDHSRAALNYSVYQLALYAISQDPSLGDRINPESIEFPIFDDPKRFRQKNKVRKLPQQHREAIESVQPYDGRNPGLWVLHELAREYRHRVVHPAAILPGEGVTHVLVNGQLVLTPDLEVIPHERLKHDDVLMRFSLPAVEPEADVKPQYAIAVSIDHPLTRGLIGTSVLNQIRKDTEAALAVVVALFAGG